MRGKLRINRIRCIEQGAGAGQVRHIGVLLVGEHRVSGQTHLLCAFDFGVPVGTLDQPTHQTHAVAPRQRDHVLYQFKRTRLVGLQRQAKAAPLRKMLRHPTDERLEHVQRELQPIHLFGVHRQVDVGARRLLAQAPDAWYQFQHHTIFLRLLVTRMQRAELDRNAVVRFASTGFVGVGGNRRNGILVTGEILQGVGVGARAFAQHVIAEPKLAHFSPGRCGFIHRLLDRLSQHKLATQQLHGTQGGGHHRTRTKLGKHATRCLAVRQKFLAHGNGGARQSSQRLVASAVKFGAPQLVSGERNRGLGIGHAQQRFGKTHQGQALGT